MPNSNEPEQWNEQIMEMEDLDIPEKGFASLAYRLGEKLYTHSPRTRLVTLLFVLCLLLCFLLSSSALTNSKPQSVHTVHPTTYPMYLPYTYGPCDGKMVYSKECKSNRGHVIIIRVSPEP